MRLIAFLLSLGLMAPTVFAETIKLKAKSKWISEAPVEKIVGSAQGKASLSITGVDFGTLKGDIVIPVASMKSGNDMRDEHLRGAEWLEADKHPNITFTIESVTVGEQNDKGQKVKVAGKITIHGVTQALNADAEIKMIEKGGKKKVKIKTKFIVELGQFNIAGKKGVVGNKVGEKIDVSTTLVGEIVQ